MSLYEVTAFSLHPVGVVRNSSLMTKGYLSYEEQEVTNSTCKFGYEESHHNRGVHLRCSHNNKYLVIRSSSSPQPNLITATADKMEEDGDHCTLFRLDLNSNGTMKWFHVQTQQYVCIYAPDNPTSGYYLCTDPDNTKRIEVECFSIDVERIIRLPKTVVFKGDNGKYLQVQDNSQHFQVFSGLDRSRKEAWYEVLPVSDGDVRIKSVRNGMFWRLSDDKSIVADTNDSSSSSPKTVFQVARLSDNSIALISRGNQLFCQRTSSNNDDRLQAEADSGVREAGLQVEEPVVSRNIKVEYRLKDARIYGEQPRSWLSQVAFNDAAEGDLQTTLSITYTEVLSCSFHVTTTVSTNISVATTFEASIPFVSDVSAEVTVEAGISVETGFEKTVDKSEQFQFTVTVTVPPGKKRRAKVMALEAKCDVPFSYILTEVQADNKTVRTHLQDGVYRGMNGYQFHVQVFDPDKPEDTIFDEPINTRVLPDTHAREKIYLRKN